MTTWSDLAATVKALKLRCFELKTAGATKEQRKELKVKYRDALSEYEDRYNKYNTVAEALKAQDFTVPALGKDVRWIDAYNGPCEGVVDAPGGDTDDYIEAEQIVVYIPSQGRSVVVDIQHFQEEEEEEEEERRPDAPAAAADVSALEEVPSSADSSDDEGALLKKRKRTTLPPVVWERRTPFADPTSTEDDEDDNVPLQQEEQADQQEEESVPSPKRQRVGLEDLMQLEFFYGEGGVLVPAA